MSPAAEKTRGCPRCTPRSVSTRNSWGPWSWEEEPRFQPRFQPCFQSEGAQPLLGSCSVSLPAALLPLTEDRTSAFCCPHGPQPGRDRPFPLDRCKHTLLGPHTGSRRSSQKAFRTSCLLFSFSSPIHSCPRRNFRSRLLQGTLPRKALHSSCPCVLSSLGQHFWVLFTCCAWYDTFSTSLLAGEAHR